MTAGYALALGFAAFTMLSLSMDRHQEQLTGRTLASRASAAWRWTGAALLGLSFGICLVRWNASLALAVWAGVLTAAAMGLGLLLSYAPRAVLPLSAVAALTGAIGGLLPVN